MSIEYVHFSDINLQDKFFNSLKEDYLEFVDWFAKKSEDLAYLSHNEARQIDGFLYLKREDNVLTDINPELPMKPRLKVGTFKIDAHGTKLGDRFVKNCLIMP